jgi:hypothetical protein
LEAAAVLPRAQAAPGDDSSETESESSDDDHPPPPRVLRLSPLRLSPPRNNEHSSTTPAGLAPLPPPGLMSNPTAPLHVRLVRAPANYTATHRVISMSPISSPSRIGNGSRAPAPVEQQNSTKPSDEDGEDEVDPPPVAVTVAGKRERGGTTGGRGRGNKRRRY